MINEDIFLFLLDIFLVKLKVIEMKFFVLMNPNVKL